MEYLYIVGIVGYYLYKAYSSNKKKQENNPGSFPTAQENPNKKKKGFFDDFLEEIEKQNQSPKTQPQQASRNTQTQKPTSIQAKESTNTRQEPTYKRESETTNKRALEPTYKRQEEHPRNKNQKIEPRRDNPLKKVQKKPVPFLTEEISSKPLNKYFEMPENDLNQEISTNDIQSILENADKPKSKRRFAGMNVSPKEALKAQIILEKRF